MGLINKFFDYKFRITTLVLVVSIAYVIGVYASPFFEIEVIYVVFGLMFIASVPKKNVLSLVICFYVAFTASVFRTSFFLEEQRLLSDLAGQKIKLLVVAKEDASYDSKKRLAFQAETVSILEPYKKEVAANIKVNTFTSSGVLRGDYLIVEGRAYSGFGNNAISIGYANVDNIASSAGSLDKLRNSFISKLRNSLPEPEASFAAGLLIGQKTGLSLDLQDNLRKAGLTHVIAVSGYNLTIIVRFIKRALSKFSRFQILAISYLLICLFISVTGMSPSILRAFIVSTIMLLSWYVGRSPKPIIILMTSMAISAFIEPLQLLRSVGWYLSFGAFFGVIILAPIFIERLKRKALWKSIIVESFCASIMTLPIIATTFEEISIIGILVNCIVAPLVPLAMLLSLLTALFTYLNIEAGGLIAMPTKYLLKFILDFSGEVSSWLGASVKIYISLISVIIFYSLVSLSAYLFYKKHSIKNVLQ